MQCIASQSRRVFMARFTQELYELRYLDYNRFDNIFYLVKTTSREKA